MKAEINLENKAKFFALYWGQKIVKDDYYQAGVFSRVLDDYFFKNMKGCYFIELKSLLDISEEDAIEVAIMRGCNNGNSKEFMIGYGSEYVKKERKIASAVADLLRYRGYLIPWMGLTCEELIKAGWAKYKE